MISVFCGPQSIDVSVIIDSILFSFLDAEYEDLWRWYRGKCIMCLGDAAAFHHLVPLSAGGASVPKNMVPLCAECHKQVHSNNPQDQIPYLMERAAIVRRMYE